MLILTFSTIAALSILCLTVITGNYYIQKGTPDFLSEQYIITKISQNQQSDSTVVRTGDLISYLNSTGGAFIVYKDFPLSNGKAIYMSGRTSFKPAITEGRSFTPEDFKNETQTISKTVDVRGDSALVKIYYGESLIKIHKRVAPGKRSTGFGDYPAELTPYALRNPKYQIREGYRRAKEIGEHL